MTERSWSCGDVWYRKMLILETFGSYYILTDKLPGRPLETSNDAVVRVTNTETTDRYVSVVAAN